MDRLININSNSVIFGIVVGVLWFLLIIHTLYSWWRVSRKRWIHDISGEGAVTVHLEEGPLYGFGYFRCQNCGSDNVLFFDHDDRIRDRIIMCHSICPTSVKFRKKSVLDFSRVSFWAASQCTSRQMKLIKKNFDHLGGMKKNPLSPEDSGQASSTSVILARMQGIRDFLEVQGNSDQPRDPIAYTMPKPVQAPDRKSET